MAKHSQFMQTLRHPSCHLCGALPWLHYLFVVPPQVCTKTLTDTLQIGSNLVESFDKLLDMLQDISENLPRFEQYASRFKGHAMFNAAISLLYYDIGIFFVKTIQFFLKRGT